MIPDGVKEVFGPYWKLLRPLFEVLAIVVASISVVGVWRAEGLNRVHAALDVWWFTVLGTIAVGAGLIVTFWRATANSRARHISAAVIGVGVFVISIHAFITRVPLTSLEIHVFPIEELDYDVGTLLSLFNDVLGPVRPRPIDVIVHTPQSMPPDLREWIKNLPERPDSTGQIANVAFITTQLQDQENCKDLSSTVGEGWSIVSSHLWKQHELGTHGIDIYQYFAHQALRTATLAALKHDGFKLGKDDAHDPRCVFDDLFRDITKKPELIAAPLLCNNHRAQLRRLIGHQATEELRNALVRIGQYSKE